jgi:diguanylate cyclase (GGDEF)-like protein/PAS domain S-box-containing protein
MQSLSTQIACFLSSGEEFLSRNEYAQALDLFENALAIAQQSQDLPAEALALQRLGTVHFKQDQLELAAASADQALNIAAEHRNPYILYDCHRQLGQIHKARCDFERALRHFELAESLRADILKHQTHPAIQYAYPEIVANAPSAKDVTPLLSASLHGFEAAQSPSTMVLLFRTMVEQANLGITIFQDDYIVYANHRFQKWLGYSPQELRQLKTTDLMPPSACWSVQQCHWQLLFEKGEGCHCEKSLRRKDGQWVDVEFHATVIDYCNRPAILAFAQDITQRKRMELKLYQSEKQFRTLFDHMPIGLYRFAHYGSPVAVNSAMAQMLGFAGRKEFFKDFYQNGEGNRQQWQDYLLHAEQTGGSELKMIRQDGRDFWVKMCAKAIVDPENHQTFYEGSMEDITEIKAAYFALEELAVRDSLTHVYNRRHFFELANRELARVKRFGRPVSLVMLDVDHFKAINDQHGHWRGDQVLQAVALNLQKNLRQSDILARYGGEEFIILMPETIQSQAWNGAERLRRILAQKVSVDGTANKTSATASFGVTSWLPSPDSDCPDIDALIKEADQALYQAKQAGRNRTIAYSNHPQPSWPGSHAWPTCDGADVLEPAVQADAPAPG